MKFKALIFGINGQDGYYLSALLISKGIEVTGISRSAGAWVKGSVEDYDFVAALIKFHTPNFIFHLAANSTTKHAALLENHNTISTGTINILEAVYKFAPTCKVFLSGSAMQFKNDGNPINESVPFDANSPYSVARIHSVYAGRYYREKLGLKVYIGYFFNHDSPLRSESHVNQKIVRAVQRINNGSRENLELGDINVKKEFNFAGDAVRAIWALIKQEEVFETVIGSGQAYSIKQWVEYCFNKINRDWNEYLTKNELFVSEYSTLVSDPHLIKSLGWQPETDFYRLADLMMQN